MASTPAKRDALQKAGFRLGTVQDFLGLSDLENRIVELKYGMSKIVKRLRVTRGLTQQEVATRIKSSQSRIAKIEAGSADVFLDLLVRCLFAVGGNLRELDAEIVKDTAGSGASLQPTKRMSAKSTKKKEKQVS